MEAGLTIAKMYDLYKEKCIRENKPWVKSTYYRYIFDRCYNIDFHIAEKLAMQEEKNKDKLTINENYLLVVVDLENVITLTKANIGSFFYKRKLTLSTLTEMASSI